MKGREGYRRLPVFEFWNCAVERERKGGLPKVTRVRILELRGRTRKEGRVWKLVSHYLETGQWLSAYKRSNLSHTPNLTRDANLSHTPNSKRRRIE